MQYGYVLYDPRRNRILTLTKDQKIKMISSNKDNIEKAFCLSNMSSVKSIYEKFKEKELVGNLEVINIQDLYRAT
tara:strand:- start:333 stop:557 length:225 start_codon:yes stop_codon:yes gene_type:complete